MKKAYLRVYSSTLGSRLEVKECLNSLREVIHWKHDLPQAYYIISEESAATLTSLIREHFGGKGRFIITEISDNKAGWLPRETWYLLKHKIRKAKE